MKNQIKIIKFDNKKNNLLDKINTSNKKVNKVNSNRLKRSKLVLSKSFIYLNINK